MKTLHIIMPMAGEGSRFSKQGWNIPKPIIEFKEKPLFIRALSSINTNNIHTKYSFIVRQNHIDNFNIKNIILNHISDANIFAVEKTTRGAVETCLIAQNVIFDDDAVLIMDCDLEFKSSEFEKLINELIMDNNSTGGVLVSFNSTLPKYSYAIIDNNNNVLKTAEKEVISNNALCGAYFFASGKEFKDVANKLINEPYFDKPEFYISLLYNYLLKKGDIIKLAKVDNYYSFGTPEELSQYL